ncbi:MAG: DUF2721 domain-containing protein [Gammaproteobacteria bacterium]|nr:DUF2721 domain-containing protein [Gammaproteobacteria bacterium]
MESIAPINAVSAAIQLAIAPVFLLASIGAILSVLTIRLGRVVDRARLVERRVAQVSTDDHRERLQVENVALWRRIKIINWAMRLAVGSALLICFVIISLFFGAFASIEIGTFLAALFILAMLLLVLALLCLLLETSISTKKMLQGAADLIVD